MCFILRNNSSLYGETDGAPLGIWSLSVFAVVVLGRIGRGEEKKYLCLPKKGLRPVHSTPPSNNQRVTTCPSSRHAGFVISLSTSCVFFFVFPFPAPFTSRRTQFVTCRTLDNRHVYSFHSDSSNLRAASPTGNGTSFEHFSEQPDLMDWWPPFMVRLGSGVEKGEREKKTEHHPAL